MPVHNSHSRLDEVGIGLDTRSWGWAAPSGGKVKEGENVNASDTGRADGLRNLCCSGIFEDNIGRRRRPMSRCAERHITSREALVLSSQ